MNNLLKKVAPIAGLVIVSSGLAVWGLGHQNMKGVSAEISPSYVRMTLSDLLKEADAIVSGEVVGVTPRLVESKFRKGDRDIVSDLEVNNLSYKYNPNKISSDTIIVTVYGGRMGEAETIFGDETVPAVGDSILVAVKKSGGKYEVVGYANGRFDISSDGHLGKDALQKDFAQSIFGKEARISDIERIVGEVSAKNIE